jgi:hypothetical protein
LEQEDDSFDKTDSGTEVSSYCRETTVLSLKKSFLQVSSIIPKRIAETKCAVKAAKIGSVGRGNIIGIPSDEVTSALQWI